MNGHLERKFFTLRGRWKSLRRREKVQLVYCSESTLSLVGDTDGAPAIRDGVLYLVANVGDLQSRVGRFALAGVDRVVIGRGRETRCRRQSPDRTLVIEIADGWLSSRNTELLRDGCTWLVRDLGSKNGTCVAGEELRGSASITDSQLLEVGSSVLLWREEELYPAELGDRLGCWRDADFWLSQEYSRTVALVDSIARSSIPVVICGETGTGKEVLARRLHERSGRSGPFVAVNCSTLEGALANSELFGHRRGAFTGATESRAGLFRRAHRGTLLLDEVAELGSDVQAKLLRVLQEGEVLPVGASEPVPVDVRVVVASHAKLDAAVDSGCFRRDLYMRLRGIEVSLPPLRQRSGDLGLLIARLAAKRNLAAPAFQRSVLRSLMEREWSGNVRELEQVLVTASELARGETITARHLLDSPRSGEAACSDSLLRQRVIDSLQRHRGNVSAVAREHGKARVQVRRWCKRWGIDVEVYRG